MRTKPRPSRALALTALLFLVSAACGDGGSGGGPKTSAGGSPGPSATEGTTSPLQEDAGSRASASPGQVYVTNFDSNNVSVIDTDSDTVIPPPVPVKSQPNGVAITPDGKWAYVTNRASDNVSVIDTADNKVKHTVKVGNGPDSVAITPDGTRAYVPNRHSGDVSVINIANNTVLPPVLVQSGTLNGVAITPNGKWAYVTREGKNDVAVINIANNTVLTAKVPVGISPIGVAITPDGTRAYVANHLSNSVSVIDTTDPTSNPPIVKHTVTVGSGPVGVAITPDGKWAYVTNRDFGTVSVIDTTAQPDPKVQHTVKVDPGPRGVAITPDGTRAYVTNQYSDIVSVLVIDSNPTNNPPIVGPKVAVGKNPVGVAILPGLDPDPLCALTINKTMSPAPLVRGQSATITLDVVNLGPGPCLPGASPGTVVRDNRPPGAGLIFAGPPMPNQPGWACSLESPRGNAICSNPATLPNGYTVTFTINAQVSGKTGGGGTLTNCGKITNQNNDFWACAENEVVP